ncbi:MAG: rhomboid family intramembrane serine protease [Pseudomonadota bacterium]
MPSASQPALTKVAPTTTALAGLCVLVWLVTLALPVAGYELSLIPARLTGAATLDGAWIPAPLTPVTMQFVHDGVGHLFLNMVFLIFIGRFVEGLIGGGRFLALFLVSGIAGALLEVALSPGSVVPHVGASGAVSGVFAAYAMIFGRREGRGNERNRAFKLAAVWIGLQLATGLAFNTGGAGGGIAIWAHVGGFLAGLVLGVPLAKDAIRRR